MMAAADVPPGTVLAGRFRVDGILGVGGMGVVFRATDIDLDVPVAIKLLRPEVADRADAFDRFRQELLLARQVSSPRVVRIHDIARHEERWLISMDLIEGESLDRVLDRRGPLPVEEAMAIARQLAEGLGAAHERGVIHRDLKPSNVLVDAEGRVFISDFGVARSLGSSGFTQAGAIVGTPDYLSPEQARGDSLDGRSDLYALGLLLYELLTGQQPFGGGTPSESISRRLVRSPPDINRLRPELPRWVTRLVHRLLQPRPSQRFADAAAVIRAIDERRVPLDLRPGARTLAAVSALVVFLAIGWGISQWAPAPAGSPPADRLVVVSDRPPASQAAGWEAAVEHLRQALATLPGQAVMDGERTAQAVAQLGLPHATGYDPAAVAGLVSSQRTLHLTLHADTTGYRISGTSDEAGRAQTLEGTQQASLAAATADFGRTMAARLQTRAAFPPTLLPDGDAALQRYGEGLLALRAGRIQDSLEGFSQATSLEPGYAAGWLALGEAALLAGQYDRAEEALSRGLQVVATPRLRSDLVALGALLGDDAEGAISDLQARFDSNPDDLETQLRLARTMGESGQHREALSLLEALLRRDPDDARAWYLSGKYLILSGDSRRAVDEHLVRALVLYKRSRQVFGEAETANALGNGYVRLGQTAEAEEQYQRALVLRRSVDDERGIATTFRNLANLAVIRGDHEQARAYIEQARKFFGRVGDRFGQAQMEREAGLLAEEQGDYGAAREAFRMALRSRQRAEDSAGIAESFNDIGFANYQLGDYDSAQVFWTQAVDAFAAAGDPHGQVRAEQNLGLLEVALGKWTQAHGRLESTLMEAERRQMAEEAAVSRRNLAELAIHRGQVDIAQRQLEHARGIFAEREDLRGQTDALLLQARTTLLYGDFTAAERLLDAFEARAASLEQRALAELLRLEIEYRRSGQRNAERIGDARTAAQAAGLPVLELAVDAHARPDNPELALQIERLGNLPLTLQWRRIGLANALASGDFETAAAHYRHALALIAPQECHADAYRLHHLGYHALHGLQDDAQASIALDAAHAAIGRLESSLSLEQATIFQTHPWVVALRENTDAL